MVMYENYCSSFLLKVMCSGKCLKDGEVTGNEIKA